MVWLPWGSGKSKFSELRKSKNTGILPVFFYAAFELAGGINSLGYHVRLVALAAKTVTGLMKRRSILSIHVKKCYAMTTR
jgi:hypothetical protein